MTSQSIVMMMIGSVVDYAFVLMKCDGGKKRQKGLEWRGWKLFDAKTTWSVLAPFIFLLEFDPIFQSCRPLFYFRR